VVSFTWAKRCLGKDPAGLFESQVCNGRVIVAHAVVIDAADSCCLRPMAEAAKRALGVDSFQIVGSTQSVSQGLEPNDWKSHEFHLLMPYGHPVSTPMIDRTLLKDRRLGLSEHERKMIVSALTQSRGRISGLKGAAAALGLPPSTLEARIKKLNIRKNRFKLG
jgi:transcriptional regulator with GAF, ATPase, and Fis domain